jgi:hypothetical protein
MAYAGTPTGLAQQAGASRPWKTALAAIAVLAIGLALVIAVMFISSRAVAPATDRGFDQIEAQRGAAALPGVDTSNAAFLNAAAAKARAMSGVAADTSYDLLENLRAQRGVPSDLSVAPGVRLDATSVDRKYQELQRRAGATSVDLKIQELQRQAGHGMLP